MTIFTIHFQLQTKTVQHNSLDFNVYLGQNSSVFINYFHQPFSLDKIYNWLILYFYSFFTILPGLNPFNNINCLLCLLPAGISLRMVIPIDYYFCYPGNSPCNWRQKYHKRISND